MTISKKGFRDIEVHIISHNDRWAVRKTYSKRLTGIFGKKANAIKYAKTLGKPIVVHKRDGTVSRTIA